MDYSKYIKFGRTYMEEWPYSPERGVGLQFSGVPRDKIKFIDILQDASCNPIAARRILSVLESGNIKEVTVMSRLAFDEIYHHLKEIGVEMKIIPPFAYRKDTDIEDNAKMDYVALNEIMGKENNAYLSDLNEEQKIEVKKRIVEVRKSLQNLPHHFGAYGP